MVRVEGNGPILHQAGDLSRNGTAPVKILNCPLENGGTLGPGLALLFAFFIFAIHFSFRFPTVLQLTLVGGFL